MNMDFYTIPLDLESIMEKKEHPKCALKESVSMILHLLTITQFGELKHDPAFGCELWEHDFENIFNSQLYKEKLMGSIRQTIEYQEPRIQNLRVDIKLEQVEIMLSNRRTKSRFYIQVTGTLKATNESFAHAEQFFIGPLSYY